MLANTFCNRFVMLVGCGIALCLCAANSTSARPMSDDMPPLLRCDDLNTVYEACGVDADVYLDTFLKQHPGETGSLASVGLHDGRRHMIVVVTFKGQQFGRDGVVGVFPIDGDVQRAFDRQVAKWSRTGQESVDVPQPRTREELDRGIATVESRLGGRSQRFRITVGRDEYDVLAWVTSDGRQALYNPKIGTAMVASKTAIGCGLVRAILNRMVGGQPVVNEVAKGAL